MRLFWILLLVTFCYGCVEDVHDTTDSELRRLVQKAAPNNSSFGFIFPDQSNFQGIPQDPNNPLTKEKVELGKMLFHETAFATSGKFDSMQGTFSCASCHHVKAGFQAGVAQGLGDGGMGFGIAGEGRLAMKDADMANLDVQPVRSPSAMNLAYQTNLLWNGQFGATHLNTEYAGTYEKDTPLEVNDLGFEGLETQAIAGLTVHRHEFSEESITTHDYKKYFDAAFPSLDNETKYSEVGAGLAIASYERTLLATQAPFQKWLLGDESNMSYPQKMGAILFFGKANCVSCHSGPALASMEFHAVGMNDLEENKAFFFNEEEIVKASLGRASFTKKPSDEYKFKVPQLYNLRDSPFYGHGSSFNSIEEVIRYKNKGIPENGIVPSQQLASTFKPLGLTEEEIGQLTNFIENALYDSQLERYVPIDLPSGNCFPNSDEISMDDLGCN